MNDDGQKTRLKLVEPLLPDEAGRFPQKKNKPWEVPGLTLNWDDAGMLCCRRFDHGHWYKSEPLTREAIAGCASVWGEDAPGIEQARDLLELQDLGLRTKPRNRASCNGGSTINSVCVRCGQSAGGAHRQTIWPWEPGFENCNDDDKPRRVDR